MRGNRDRRAILRMGREVLRYCGTAPSTAAAASLSGISGTPEGSLVGATYADSTALRYVSVSDSHGCNVGDGWGESCPCAPLGLAVRRSEVGHPSSDPISALVQASKLAFRPRARRRVRESQVPLERRSPAARSLARLSRPTLTYPPSPAPPSDLAGELPCIRRVSRAARASDYRLQSCALHASEGILSGILKARAP